MKPLSSIEIKLCQKQAKVFEDSVSKTEYSSPIFIRRFMYSSIAKSFDNKLYLFSSETEDDVFETLEEEFGESNYGKIKYSQDQMFWIGYVYRCISIKYNLSSKIVYKLFKANEIVKYYNICHTFDIVDAAERMMESVNYDNSPIEKKAYNIMRRLLYAEILEEYLGKTVNVVIDHPIGSDHNGVSYKQNYGYVPGLKGLDNDFQDAYIIDENKKLRKFNGKVIAIVRNDDSKDKLVVCDKNKTFSKEEIMEKIEFQEKYKKSKIIMNI